jgi:hypothetical protein
MTGSDYSKIILRANSEAPFASLATVRSVAPLSSSKTQPPLRATIAPMRPTPATLSPGAAARIAPSIFQPDAIRSGGDNLDRSRVLCGVAG